MWFFCSKSGDAKHALADADDGDFGGDLLETVQETQNDEEEQALTGSQVRRCCLEACSLHCHL